MRSVPFVYLEKIDKKLPGGIVQCYKYKQMFRNDVDKYAFVYYYWGTNST